MLSKQTTDQIRKEAKEGFPNSACLRDGYETGAMAWAVWKEKAEGAKAALGAILIVNANGYNSGTIKDIATRILEQFK